MSSSSDESISVGESILFQSYCEEGEGEQLIYTEWHYESAVLSQLLDLQKVFRANYELMKSEFVIQRETNERLWLLSQRYALLASTGRCCKYPEIYALPAEEVIINEFHQKFMIIVDSNTKLMDSVNKLREECRIFNKLCTHLNLHNKTDFTLGDKFHRPIIFFIEMVKDLFNYIHCWVLRLQVSFIQIEVSEFKRFEAYNLLIMPNEDFGTYLSKEFVYCKCLRPKSNCELKTKILGGQADNCI